MSHIPAYKEVYSKLKEELKEGIYPAGSLLPTESELEKIFHVSRTTIRKAISILSLEGYVKTKQGYGTEVLNIFTVQKLNQITSITETLRQKGYTVKTKSMYIEKITAPESIMSIMEMHTPAPVYKVQRVQTADGVPIALMTNYVKCSYTPGLEKYIDGFTSFYSFLEKKYKIIFSNAVQYLSAVSANFTESQILEKPVGSPLLCSRRICYSGQDPFLYGITKLASDKYEYCVSLQNRP